MSEYTLWILDTLIDETSDTLNGTELFLSAVAIDVTEISRVLSSPRRRNLHTDYRKTI